MSELLIAIVSAVVGAGAVYLLDLRKMDRERREQVRRADEERQRKKAATATGLLIDVRTLENILRQLYRSEHPGNWRGVPPTVLYQTLLPDLVDFQPATTYEVANFFGLVRDTSQIIGEIPTAGQDADRWEHAIRCKAAFALQALPDVASRLVMEGGVIPRARPLDLARFPELPRIPERYFSVTMARAGESLPDELQ